MEGQESIPRVVPEGKSLRKESERSSQASLASLAGPSCVFWFIAWLRMTSVLLPSTAP